MSQYIETTTLMYVASRHHGTPDEAIARLTPIASREVDTLAEMFPNAPIEEVQKFIRSYNVYRNYGRAGYEIGFASGYGFDINAFLDSFANDDSLVVEIHTIRYEKGDDSNRGENSYRAGKETIEDPENFDWEMLSYFRLKKLRREAEELQKRFLQGQKVVATGRLEKYSEKRVTNEIKVLGAKPQDQIDERTTLVLVGHEPDPAIVDQAIDNNLDIMHGRLFGLLVQYGEQNHWEAPVEFRTENLTKHGKFIVRERNFNNDGGPEIYLSGWNIAHIAREKEKAQKVQKRLSAQLRRDLLDDFPDLKGKRMYDVVELERENELFLVFAGDGSKPRESAEFGMYGEFLLFAPSEEQAHKLAVADLFHMEEDTLTAKPEQLSENPEALLSLIRDSNGLTYDTMRGQLEIGSTTQPETMIQLNRLLRKPIYQVKAVSPIDIMRYEAELVQVH